MAAPLSSSVPMPESMHTVSGSAPTRRATPCLSSMVHVMQMGCLVFIPIFAVSLVFFLSIFTIKCGGSSGFVINQSGEVNCVLSKKHLVLVGDEVQQVPSSPDMISENGFVVMTVTRVVLMSVSALIVSFTAWICVWYQLYGKSSRISTQPEDPVMASGSDPQVPLESVLTIRVNEFLAKEDMERLLGPEHSAAPAV